MISRLLAIAILGLSSLYSSYVFALTVEQFSSICQTVSGNCSDHPILQAYVGGALDLLATLDEETDHLEKLYCKEPKELFNVPVIIQFMQAHGDEYASRNAMLLVVRYFEEKGGCPPRE